MPADIPPGSETIPLSRLGRGDVIWRDGITWTVRSSRKAGAPGNPNWWEVRYGHGVTRIRLTDPEWIIEGPRDTPVILITTAAEARAEARWGETDD